MVTPQLLATSYLVHLVATVVWIGGIVFVAFVVTPATASEPGSSRLLAAIQRRFTPIANLSLIVLIVTGMVQLTANPNYVGFLNFSNTWAKAILLKHIAVGGMILAGLYMNLVLQPDIQSDGDAAGVGQSHSGRHGRPDSPPVTTDANQHGAGDCGAAVYGGRAGAMTPILAPSPRPRRRGKGK